MEAVPFLSQLKSLVQYFEGDTEGALETQRNFSKTCPVVSQIRSFIELVSGDPEAALETQKEFSVILNSVPVMGHLKGLVHYATGEIEGGHEAMKAATRATGNVVGGVVGFELGGPAGACIGGLTGSVSSDAGLSALSVATNEEKDGELYGIFQMIQDLYEKKGKMTTALELATTLFFDGAAGVSCGETWGRNKAVNVTIPDNIKQTVNPVAITKLIKDGQKMTGNTLRNMPAENEIFRQELLRIEEKSSTKRQKSKQIRDAKQKMLHTDSHFHKLYQSDSLKNLYSADVHIPEQTGRGVNRMLFLDEHRNYNLSAVLLSRDHYRDVNLPPLNGPGIFQQFCNEYADLPGTQHIATKLLTPCKIQQLNQPVDANWQKNSDFNDTYQMAQDLYKEEGKMTTVFDLAKAQDCDGLTRVSYEETFAWERPMNATINDNIKQISIDLDSTPKDGQKMTGFGLHTEIESLKQEPMQIEKYSITNRLANKQIRDAKQNLTLNSLKGPYAANVPIPGMAFNALKMDAGWDPYDVHLTPPQSSDQLANLKLF